MEEEQPVNNLKVEFSTVPETTEIVKKVATMFVVNQPNYSLPDSREVKQSGGYQSYGLLNDYPKSLINMFFQSSLHNAIIQRKCDEIVGNGIYSEDPKLQSFLDKCNDRGGVFEDIFRKIVLDYLIFGGFTMQMVHTKATEELAGVFYTGIDKYRYNIIDPEKRKIKLKYARDWGMQRVKTIEYDLYQGDKKGSSIFYYAGTTTREFYPVPEYVGSIAGIESSIEIQNFHLNCIKNGMFPSLFIDMKNGIPTDEEQREIERQMLQKFAGSNSAGKVIFNYSENTEVDTVKITPITQPDSDKRFITLQDAIRDNIFIGHRITNSALFGVQQAGKLGGQSAEYAEGYEIFQKTYILPQQRIILRTLNKLFQTYFPGAELKIKKLEPIGNFFTDQVLIGSMLTEIEFRSKLKETGWIDTVEVPKGQKLMKDLDVVTELDTTSSEFVNPEKTDVVTEDTPETINNN